LGNTKHGHAKSESREYRTYDAMKRRCLDTKNKNFKFYGKRGVTVCDRWLGESGFSTFLADMGPRPFGLSLDRIDGSLGYSPDNCRWANKFVQARNRKSTKLTPEAVIEIRRCAAFGEKQRDIARRMGVSNSAINDIVRGRRWTNV